MIVTNDSNQIVVHAPAKVNWFLELLSKRSDGFHQIETCMSTVSLYDTLTFSQRDDDQVRLSVCGVGLREAEISSIPTGSENLVVRAANLMLAAGRDSGGVGLDRGVNIGLRKRIPSAAGLGGASSDAAATMVVMNRLWQINMTVPQMNELAGQMGSDVPFFLSGGTALCEGRGEIISPVNCPTSGWLVIAKPSNGLSTPLVYSKVVLSKSPTESGLFFEALKGGRMRDVGKQLHNRLQEFALVLNEQVDAVKQEFEHLTGLMRCCGHQLSGSGSSYFGLFASRRSAVTAVARLRGRLPQVQFFVCRMLPSARLAGESRVVDSFQTEKR